MVTNLLDKWELTDYPWCWDRAAASVRAECAPRRDGWGRACWARHCQWEPRRRPRRHSGRPPRCGTPKSGRPLWSGWAGSACTRPDWCRSPRTAPDPRSTGAGGRSCLGGCRGARNCCPADSPAGSDWKINDTCTRSWRGERLRGRFTRWVVCFRLRRWGAFRRRGEALRMWPSWASRRSRCRWTGCRRCWWTLRVGRSRAPRCRCRQQSRLFLHKHKKTTLFLNVFLESTFRKTQTNEVYLKFSIFSLKCLYL